MLDTSIHSFTEAQVIADKPRISILTAHIHQSILSISLHHPHSYPAPSLRPSNPQSIA
jgi:hypothetical protein